MTRQHRTIIVPVSLPEPLYQALAAQAAEARVPVGLLIARGLERAVRPHVKKRSALVLELQAKIRALNAEGLNDTQIAKRLGVHQVTASKHRREMGLPKRTR